MCVTWAVFAAVMASLCGCGSPERTALQRGDASAEAGDLATAILHYSEAIRLDPDSPAAYAKRGAAYLSQAEYRKAAADFDEAIRLAPENGCNYVKRGLAHLRLEAYDKAIADFNVAIDRFPKAGEAYAGRGEAHLRQEEFGQAITDLSRAIELNPNDAGLLSLRGRAYFGNGSFELAEADFTQAIQQSNGTDAYAYWNRARVRESLNMKSEAQDDRQQAVSLDPSFDVPDSSLGKQAITELRGGNKDVLGSASIDPDLGN